MKNLTILNENMEAYKKLLLIKEKNLYNKKNKNKIETTFKLHGFASIICCIAAAVLVSQKVISLPIGYITLSLGPVTLLAGLVSQKVMTKYFLRKEFNEFTEEYPEFDTNISYDDIAKILEKAKQPVNDSEIQNKISEEQQHINSIKNNFAGMTTDEKIHFLEQERDFWEQVRIHEDKVKTDDINHQKTIGKLN